MMATIKNYYVNVFQYSDGFIYTGSVFDNKNDIEIDKDDCHDGKFIKTLEFYIE